jgi:hypothetical protein
MRHFGAGGSTLASSGFTEISIVWVRVALPISFFWYEGGRMIPKGGRLERRSRSTLRLRIFSLDRPWLVELATTENVSPSGARILVKDAWKPGERVAVELPGMLDPSQARVIYCELLKTGSTAVGLQLARPHPDWVR